MPGALTQAIPACGPPALADVRAWHAQGRMPAWQAGMCSLGPSPPHRPVRATQGAPAPLRIRKKVGPASTVVKRRDSGRHAGATLHPPARACQPG